MSWHGLLCGEANMVPPQGQKAEPGERSSWGTEVGLWAKNQVVTFGNLGLFSTTVGFYPLPLTHLNWVSSECTGTWGKGCPSHLGRICKSTSPLSLSPGKGNHRRAKLGCGVQSLSSWMSPSPSLHGSLRSTGFPYLGGLLLRSASSCRRSRFSCSFSGLQLHPAHRNCFVSFLLWIPMCKSALVVRKLLEDRGYIFPSLRSPIKFTKYKTDCWMIPSLPSSWHPI